jgi:hypothetical protein
MHLRRRHLLIEILNQHLLNLNPRLCPAFYRPQNWQLADFACFLQHCRGRGDNRSIPSRTAGNAGTLGRKRTGRITKGEDCCGQAEGGKKYEEGANSL